MPPKGAPPFGDGREEKLHDYLLSLPDIRGNPHAVLKAMTDYIDNHKGMITLEPSKIRLSRSIIEKLDPKPKIVVELGGYMGVSAIGWGTMLKDFHSAGGNVEGCKVYTCEYDPKFAQMIRDHVEFAGLSDVIKVMEGQASDSLKRIKEEEKVETMDMLFLDHWKQYYLPDTKLCEELKLFKKGTLILADNTDVPGAPDYLAYIRSGGSGNFKYETKTYDSPEPVESGAKVIEATTVVGA